MSNPLITFDEPDLEFRFGQKLKDPHDGLALFGPYDADQPTRPSSLNYIAIGTPAALDTLSQWMTAMNEPVTKVPKDNYRLWPPFPGFEAVFNCQLSSTPAQSFKVDRENLLTSSRLSQQNERAAAVVGYYIDALRTAKKLDAKIDVAICVVPDEVWMNCRPLSRVADAVGEKMSSSTLRQLKAGQMDMFRKYDLAVYNFSPDFRRQLKARAMEYGIPVQVIRESTLRLTVANARGERGLTPLSDRMWNLATTLYYKAGGKPWRLVTARDGVCYIGLAFRKAEQSESEATACCAAQMFLDTGDGIVFLGEFGPWYSPQSKQCHLTGGAAGDLLKGVLGTYQELEGKKLNEVFLHSRSDISKEEFEGYQAACPTGAKVVGVRVRADRSFRLFRQGKMPVVRGTFLRISDRSGYLWASGFKNRLATYDGWETPVPLRIDVQHGDVAIERVAQDIFGLTKLNYNACRIGENNPVTVAFSDAVGEILISNPDVPHRRPNFKFYI
jgi:hypothetical protein